MRRFPQLSALFVLVLSLYCLLTGAAARAATPQWPDRWPQDPNREYAAKRPYETETWSPPARRLMWAHPGKSWPEDKEMNPKDPKNWLDMATGQPAAALPDENTDVLFPACDKPYGVHAAWSGGRLNLAFRHLVIQKNASFSLENYEVWGNLWIQEGGSMGSHHASTHKGSKHTFVFNENKDRSNIAQYIIVNKYKGASVWFIGNISATDELSINEGTAVIGPHSKMTAGPNSIQNIGPEATLALLSGASFGKGTNNAQSHVDILVKGHISAGTPECPLTKDAFLGLSFKDAAGAPGAKGLIVEPKGVIRVYSKDPATARLVIGWHQNKQRDPRNEPGKYDKMPRTINVALLGSVPLNGVLFNDVRKGGIELPDPAARQQWKNVSFGKGCAAAADELFGRYEGPSETSTRSKKGKP